MSSVSFKSIGNAVAPSKEKQATRKLLDTGHVANQMSSQVGLPRDRAMHVGSVGKGVVPFRDMVDKHWVPSHINKRSCVSFMAKTDKDGNASELCHCGYKEAEHDQNMGSRIASTGKYSINNNTIPSHTNAFGEMEFVGFSQNISKYVRVDHETSMDTMLSLMIEHWGLEKPNLLISVTGGAKNFSMKPRLKEMFRRGLMKAASSTGAWIITGGMHAGVMKHVGEAVRDHMVAQGSAKNQVTAIGIATWGCVSRKKSLINPKGCWPAQYNTDSLRVPKESPLDHNHSHHILVDNGTQHQFGVEINFRTKLENAISKMKTDTGMGEGAVAIPVVCLVLEGGPGTLETVKSAIQNGTPAVIVEGSGRAADILAYAYNNCKTEEVPVPDHDGKIKNKTITIIDSKLEMEITGMIEKNWKNKELSRRVGWVKACVQNMDLITVFQLDSKDSVKDIDQAILLALLKANRNQVMDQLKLALAWNRIDVAKSEIFTDETKWQHDKYPLYDVMYTALIQNRTSFIKLFLDNGLNLREFLTIKRILQLYNNIPRNTLLYQLLEKEKKDQDSEYFSFVDIGLVIQSLMGDFYQPLYLRSGSRFRSIIPEDYLDAPVRAASSATARQVQLDGLSQNGTKYDKASGKPIVEADFEQPTRELFMWSILLNRVDLAMIFWDEGKDSMAASLTAAQILKVMGQKTDDFELNKEIDANIKTFQEISFGVLTECYAADDKRAQMLLVRDQSNYGSTTPLLLAVEADDKNFISHACCQALLSNIWLGRMSRDTGNLRIWASVICPPLIFLLINFREDKRDSEQQKEKERHRRSMKRKKKNSPDYVEMEEVQDTGSTRSLVAGMGANNDESDVMFRPTPGKLKWWKRITHFYNAPLVTFIFNCLSYIVFLAILSGILLTQLRPGPPTIAEIIVIVWVFTLTVEEIRQLMSDDSSNFRLRVTNYITETWNIVDTVTILLFLIGMILRFIPDNPKTFEWARIILALDLMGFFFRVLHIFSVFKELGPMLVMIGKMIVDIFYFMIILMVFILAYGMASQAILYPNAPLEAQLVQDVLRKSYWQMYGELFLEEIEGAEDCTLDENLWRNNTLPRCPENTWVVPILLGFYILFTNILMFNLLIAMFSYTFNNVQEITDQVWKYQRYFLVYEYYDRPPLAPPIIIIAHVYLLIRGIVRRCRNATKLNTAFKVAFTEVEDRRLVLWENMNADEYRRRTLFEQTQNTDSRVEDTNEKVENLVRGVDEMREIQSSTAVVRHQTGKLPPQLDKRLAYLEEQMQRTSKALDWIIQSMIEKNMGSSSGAPDLPDVDELREEEKRRQEAEIQKEKEIVELMLKKQLEIHVKARTSPYPGSDILRFDVPDDKVSWTVPFPEYSPAVFTDSDVLSGPEWADPDILSMEIHARPVLAYNEQDGVVDRRSSLGNYFHRDSIPLNPKGRTGVIGRGKLGRWGPNHAGDPVVTRWKRTNSGDVVLENGKPVLQFVAIQRQDTHEWAIPGQLLQTPQCSEDVAIMGGKTSVSQCLKAEFKEEALGNLMRDPRMKDEIQGKLNELFSDGVEVYKGYSDDQRNTDNAWIETCAVNYHDDEGHILNHFILRPGDGADGAIWQEVSSKTSFYGAHSIILKKVADMHHAAF